MRRHFFAAAVAVLALTTLACSGKQTLYVASDRPEELSVKINGSEQQIPLRTFQAYSRVKLTKGAEVTVTPSDNDTSVNDLGGFTDQLEGGIVIINVPVVDAKATSVTVKATVGAGKLEDAVVKVFPDAFTYVVMRP